jgi:hypothetical protein
MKHCLSNFSFTIATAMCIVKYNLKKLKLRYVLHMQFNYLAMLEQAKAQRKSKRWFICDEELK